MDRISKKTWLILILVVAVMGMILGLLFWALSDNSGTVTERSNKKVVQSERIVDLDGQYIAFKHSSRYYVTKNTAADRDLELYSLDANTNYEKKVSVAVSTLPSGQLDSSSVYLLRSSQPDTYEGKTISVDGTSGVRFTKRDGTEQTVVIVKSGREAVLAFVSQGDPNELTTEVDQILATFRWKQ